MTVTPDAPARMSNEDQRWSALMAAAQKGDRVAYETLLRECVPQVRRIARRSGLAPDLIDDVVQETLIAIHRARHTFEPDRSFMAWLNAIARRRAIDGLRAKGRRGSREIHEPTAYENHPDEAANAEEQRLAEGRGVALRQAIAGLSHGQREAIEAIGLREATLDETAAATGKTKGALKVNFHRALKALRGRLGQEQ